MWQVFVTTRWVRNRSLLHRLLFIAWQCNGCMHSWTPVSSLRKFGSFKISYISWKRWMALVFAKCHPGCRPCRDSLKTQPPVPPLNLSQVVSLSQSVCVWRDWKSWLCSQRNINLNSICSSAACLPFPKIPGKNNFSCECGGEGSKEEGRVQGDKLENS